MSVIRQIVAERGRIGLVDQEAVRDEEPWERCPGIAPVAATC